MGDLDGVDVLELSVENVRRRGLRLPAGTERRGVYRLTFRDGSHYVGRTNDVVVRMGGHFRTYDDIIRIAFYPVPQDDLAVTLDSLEERVGGRDVAANGIRSSAVATMLGDPTLARLQWIETHIAESEMHQRPLEAPGQRQRTRPNFERLTAHSDFELLRQLVHRYLERVIPIPCATERRNWVITSMPSTARTRVWHRLLCLSVNNVEALTIGEQFDGMRWTTVGFMSAASWRASSRARLPAAAVRSGAFVAPVHYATVGDVSQIGFDSLMAMGALLSSGAVLDHVGELVMRLMHRGRGLYGQFHDYNLADAVLDL